MLWRRAELADAGAGRSSVAKTAEGDRVAERLRRGDGVLPGPAGAAGQDVGRAPLELEGGGHACLRAAALESHAVGREQRNADYLGAEHRGVPMPSDAGPGGVPRDERYYEVRRRESGQSGAAIAQPAKLARQRIAGLDSSGLVSWSYP